jgi:hypothetical protein
MEFRNLTPVDALAFTNIDVSGREYHIVVVKAGYQLRPISNKPDTVSDRCSFSDRPLTHFCELLEGEGDDEFPGAVPLVMADEYVGDIGTSSVKYESDLAPYKPRCDVVVSGHSYAPNNKAAESWAARLRISVGERLTPESTVNEPQPLNPMMSLSADQVATIEAQKKAAARLLQTVQPRVLLDKSLQIYGERWFKDSLLGWSLTATQPTQSTGLLWEHAFGGASVVKNPAVHSPTTYLLNEVCYSNPIGCGWIDQRWSNMLEKAELKLPSLIPAPRILHAGEKIDTPQQATNPPIDVPQGYEYRVMAQAVKDYPTKPAGLSWVGRGWIPRLPLAGTYDHNWQEHRWPGLPEDFDFGYWNGAPADQQITFPPADFQLELLNLTPPRYPECGISTDVGTYVAAQLPGHRACLLIRTKDGLMLPMPMTIDTIVFDTEKMLVNVSWRVGVLKSIDARVIEARFEQNPNAPLVRIQDPEDHTHEITYG